MRLSHDFATLPVKKGQSMSHDIINKPKHYTACPSGVECIEIAELLPFCLGNCYKYLHRAGLKGDKKQDLQKAQYYAKRAMFNGETMPSVAKARLWYVSSHKNANNNVLLWHLGRWDADKNGDFARRFIEELTKEIDLVDDNPKQKERKIIGYRIGFLGYDLPVYDDSPDQKTDSSKPQET